LIPPDLPHAHPAFGASAILFLERESVEWAHFSDYHNGGPVELSLDHRLRPWALRAATGDTFAAQKLVDLLIGKSAGDSASFDPVILQTCEHIRQHLDRPITLAALAKSIHRSPSRLAHRFREATGVPVRRFILWRRLRAAAEAAIRGSSLTEAAHAAGFADSAHLSRTFRSTFGIVPSILFKRGQLDVKFLPALEERSH
jgi:AraC-like DNA-binding protein